MIIIFVSGLLAAAAMYKLGAYVTLVAVVTTVTKVSVVLAGLIALVLLYRHRRRSQHRIQAIGR